MSDNITQELIDVLKGHTWNFSSSTLVAYFNNKKILSYYFNLVNSEGKTITNITRCNFSEGWCEKLIDDPRGTPQHDLFSKKEKRVSKQKYELVYDLNIFDSSPLHPERNLILTFSKNVITKNVAVFDKNCVVRCRWKD